MTIKIYDTKTTIKSDKGYDAIESLASKEVHAACDSSLVLEGSWKVSPLEEEGATAGGRGL